MKDLAIKDCWYAVSCVHAWRVQGLATAVTASSLRVPEWSYHALDSGCVCLCGMLVWCSRLACNSRKLARYSIKQSGACRVLDLSKSVFCSWWFDAFTCMRKCSPNISTYFGSPIDHKGSGQ